MSTEEKVTRKLRAILSADVKGYSLLMSDDEAFTVKILKDYRAVMSKLIDQHTGRVVDDPGDNLLAEFASVVDAVQCAVEIQKILKERNENLSEDKRLEFRIGVNIGDVIQDRDRLYGEGVNIAARIESLADPGGVCISRNAYDHIRNKINLGYEYLGEHSVKNIKHPVRVYKLLMADEDAGKLIGDRPKRATKKWIWATAVLAVIMVTSFIWQVYQKMAEPEFEPASIDAMAFALPDKPSIVVLPFDNMSNDSQEDYFSDGITEQIITTLSRYPRIFVIARQSAFRYKEIPVKIQKVAEDLGVQYVLKGGVQKSDNRLRITVQLVDAISGSYIWSERYDRKHEDIFALQDEITINVMNNMVAEMTEGEQARRWTGGETNLKALEKHYQAQGFFCLHTMENYEKARPLFEEAIAFDPEFVWPYVYLGYCHINLARGSKSPAKSLQTASELAQKALDIDDTHDGPHSLLSLIYRRKGQLDKALVEAKKAIELNPNSSDSYMMLSFTLGEMGRWEESVLYGEKSLRLSPFPGAAPFMALGRAYFMTGQYDKSIETFKKALKVSPKFFYGYIYLAACYSATGRDKEAAAAAKEVLRLNPGFTIESYSRRLLYKNDSDKERLASALRKAGFPEYPPGKEPPAKPSIAVLPFDNLSDDPEQEYFIDGIAEDIITALSKTNQLVVIARNSSFSYKGKPVKIKQVAEELGVRYVLEGSVRKTQDRVRITAQLIDATTEHHLWAERYDRDLNDIFALQDEITMKIVAALNVKLTSGEQGRIYERQYKTLKGLMKFSELGSAWDEGTEEGLIRHGQLAQELIEMEPDSPGGYTSLGWYHWQRASQGMSPQENIEKAFELAQKAISLDESNDFSYALLGAVYLQMRQYEKAIAAGEKSVALLPNGAFNHTLLGHTLTYADKPGDALYHIKQGLRLDPYPEYWKFYVLARCYWVNKQYEEALTALNKVVHLAPGSWTSQVLLAITYVRLDRQEEAETAAKKVLDIFPAFSIERLSKTLPYKNQDVLQRIVESAHKAGLPM